MPAPARRRGPRGVRRLRGDHPGRRHRGGDQPVGDRSLRRRVAGQTRALAAGIKRQVTLGAVTTVGFDVAARLGTLLTAMVTPFSGDGSWTPPPRRGWPTTWSIRGATVWWSRAPPASRRPPPTGRKSSCCGPSWKRWGTGPVLSPVPAPMTPRTASGWPRLVRPRVRTGCWWSRPTIPSRRSGAASPFYRRRRRDRAADAAL